MMRINRVERMVCLLVCVVIVFAGCGGGGGSGDGGGNADPITPQQGDASYIYEVYGLTDDAESAPGLEVQWTVEDETPQNMRTVRIHPNPGNSMGFRGTIDPVSRQVTIDNGSGMDIQDLNDPIIFGDSDFRIRIEETIVLPYDADPESGMIRIEPLVGNSYSIRITLAGTNGDVWVEYDMDGNGSYEDNESFVWDDFDELWLTSNEPRQLMAKFGLDACQFMLTQVQLVEYALEALGENEDEFIPGPYTDTGNRFSAYGLTPPTGIVDQGDFTATLIDSGTGNVGSVGPGDGFDIVCDQVWINDQGSEDDYILHGSVALLGYTDVVDNNVTTRIGFEPYGAAPGGVFLHDFTEYFTTTDEPNVLIDTTLNIRGAFSIVFRTP